MATVKQVAAVTRRRVAGIGLLCIVLAFGAFTYAVFTKQFRETVDVTVQTSRIGLQLPDAADVKVRGLIVGEVTDVQTSGDGAKVTLGLDPSMVAGIPADVTALIVPKTLFGEKYVSLEVPDGAPIGDALSEAGAIEAGDVIQRTDVPVEVETVLADVYPLLTAVQPTDLSYTLNALATALEGRGERIGENLTRLDGYLTKLNPEVPQLVSDLEKLGITSDIYRANMPRLAAILRNTTLTGSTVIDKEQQIHDLFVDVTNFSSTTRDFLQQNGDEIVRLGRVSLPVTNVLAEYSPEYPCMVRGLVNWIPRMNEVFRDHTLHINLELLPQQPTGYSPADQAQYQSGFGPMCHTLPNPPYDQDNPGPTAPPQVIEASGVDGDHGKFRTAPGTGERLMTDPTSGFAGTSAEQQVLAAIAAPVLGVDADDVPGLTGLLLGPLTRGTEVSVR